MDLFSKTYTWLVAQRQRADDYIVNNWMSWTPADIPDQTGKVALVTGATSGIGYECSRKLAENNAKVYMVGRNMEKLDAAAAAIRKEIGKSAMIETILCDLSNMDEVVQLANTFKRSGDPLHILINNAGCYFPGPFKLVKGNLEQTMAVNYFAPALLTLMLLDKMQPDGRIVMTSSEGEAMGKVDWGNLRGDKYKSSGNRAYAASKLYNLMWATELGTRLRKGAGSHVSPMPAKSHNIDVISVQPGLVASPGHAKMDKEHYMSSQFVSGMAALFGQSPYHGAFSTLYAATSPDLTGEGHAYIGPNVLNMVCTTFHVWPLLISPLLSIHVS
ncbi:hypothetical protein DUNSADRAFT_15155 [Dunaliella salina]|uniref:Uncharacterized protein n=1 Tax=Dunaliella salina TaxID=3046 RepID=A0ABQ7G5Y4_DUNSA|nr:hypothetical protein DUNSADRAFT_15155 [Dunaliella salina]|eukprot:KAF5830029.1 hypothetical protein DUNSADRAFT_15155 [Dunaliella salina]